MKKITTTVFMLTTVLTLVFTPVSGFASANVHESFDHAFSIPAEDYNWDHMIASWDRLLTPEWQKDEFYEVRMAYVRMLGEPIEKKSADRRSETLLAMAGWDEFVTYDELKHSKTLYAKSERGSVIR